MRRVAAVALIALLLAACGSGTGGGGGEPDARVTFDEPLRVGPVTWKITVTNDTTHALDLTFPTGQRAEVTLSQHGRTIYQWSRGQMFTQMVGHVRIPAGGNHVFNLDEPGLDVDPGVYTLTAVVVASNRHDLRDEREVTVLHM
jgi:hypothetical protein